MKCNTAETVVISEEKDEKVLQNMSDAGLNGLSKTDLIEPSLNSLDLLPDKKQEMEGSGAILPATQASMFQVVTEDSLDLGKFTFNKYTPEFVQREDELLVIGETGKCFAVLGEDDSRYLLQRLLSKVLFIAGKSLVRPVGRDMGKGLEFEFGVRWPKSSNFVYRPGARDILSHVEFGQLLVIAPDPDSFSTVVSVLSFLNRDLGIFKIDSKKCRVFPKDVLPSVKQKMEADRVYLNLPITDAEWAANLKFGTGKQRTGPNGEKYNLIPQPGDFVCTREGDLGFFLVSWVSPNNGHQSSHEHIYMEGVVINYSEKEKFTPGPKTGPKVRTFDTDKKGNFYYLNFPSERAIVHAMKNPDIAKMVKDFKSASVKK